MIEVLGKLVGQVKLWFVSLASISSIFSQGVVTIPSVTPAPILTPTISITTTPTPIQYIAAVGTYSDYGKTVNISIKFPKEGGNLTGSISGVCTGTVSGQYSKGEIYGTISGRCSEEKLGFAFENKGDIDTAVAKATYKGKVDLSKKIIRVDFDGGIYPNAPYDNTSLHLPYVGRHTILTIK